MSWAKDDLLARARAEEYAARHAALEDREKHLRNAAELKARAEAGRHPLRQYLDTIRRH